MTRHFATRLLCGSALLSCVVLIQASARASVFDQSNTAAGTASVSACSGIGYSPGATPGTAWVPGINGAGGATVCNYAMGTNPGVSSAATGSSGSNPFPYVDSSTASAAIQQIHLGAKHSGDSGYFFPEGYAQGGWNDSLTLSTTGIWVLPITVLGTFNSSGPNGSADGYLEIFQNGNDFEAYSPAQAPAYNTFLALNNTHNGCVGPSSWSPEIVGWGVTGDRYPGVCPGTLSATTVFFAIPVTAGNAFQFGIWASVRAGEYAAGNSSPDLPLDTASADLTHTFLWGGPGYVIDSNGQIHTDFTISSLSGSDYNVAAVDSAAAPEPATLELFGGSIAGLGLLSRRRNRKSE